MTSNVVASFAEASRKGQIQELVGVNQFREISSGRDWDIAAFDFGKIFLPNLGNEKLHNAMYSAWIEHHNSGKPLKIPFSECLYYFDDDYEDGYPAVSILHLKKSDMQITVGVYQQASRNGAFKWLRDPYFLIIDRHTTPSVCFRPDVDKLPPEWRFDVTKEARRDWNMLIIATMLLNHQSTAHEIQPSNPMLQSVNMGRARAGLRPIPATITIKVNREAITRIGHGNGDPGASRVPHNRRGHWRTYKATGKSVWVRCCSINGGDQSKPYRIIT